MKFIRSKAFRLALLFTALIAAVTALFAAFFVFALRSRIRANQSAELFDALEVIKNGALDSFESTALDVPYYISYCIYEDGESGEILFTNDPFIPALPKTDLKIKTFVERNFFMDGDLNVLYCTRDFEYGGAGYVAQVSLSLELDWGERLLRGILPSLALLLIPLLSLSGALAFFITNQTMKPVKKIARTAESISLNNLEEQFTLSGSGDEFDSLSSTFNTLFKRLNNDLKREKQFTSDVSHELKTPLTVISGHVNLIKRWGKDDPAQLESSLDRISAEVSSMRTIIEKLLELSRLDAGSRLPKLEYARIEDLFDRLKEDARAWAPNAEFSLEGPEIEVLCDKEMLYEIFKILTSNSVKYSDGNAAVKISAEQTVGLVSISVSDNGPGISKEVLPHAFERFYRGDESHARSTPGSGLGLAIVKSIMEAHGGTADIFSDGKTGTTVLLRFKSPNRARRS